MPLVCTCCKAAAVCADLRHWVLGLQQQLQLGWLQVQHHVHQAALQLHYIPLPSVLLAAAVTLALLLLAAAVKQRQVSIHVSHYT